jgi:hypothetical protein
MEEEVNAINACINNSSHARFIKPSPKSKID